VALSVICHAGDVFPRFDTSSAFSVGSLLCVSERLIQLTQNCCRPTQYFPYEVVNANLPSSPAPPTPAFRVPPPYRLLRVPPVAETTIMNFGAVTPSGTLHCQVGGQYALAEALISAPQVHSTPIGLSSLRGILSVALDLRPEDSP